MSATYKRTTCYRTWMKRRRYMPTFAGGFARLTTGRVYELRRTGWIRRDDVAKKWAKDVAEAAQEETNEKQALEV